MCVCGGRLPVLVSLSGCVCHSVSSASPPPLAESDDEGHLALHTNPQYLKDVRVCVEGF